VKLKSFAVVYRTAGYITDTIVRAESKDEAKVKVESLPKCIKVESVREVSGDRGWL
jgi:hypothetical protein